MPLPCGPRREPDHPVDLRCWGGADRPGGGWLRDQNGRRRQCAVELHHGLAEIVDPIGEGVGLRLRRSDSGILLTFGFPRDWSSRAPYLAPLSYSATRLRSHLPASPPASGSSSTMAERARSRVIAASGSSLSGRDPPIQFRGFAHDGPLRLQADRRARPIPPPPFEGPGGCQPRSAAQSLSACGSRRGRSRT
jgi:hypothetical protein